MPALLYISLLARAPPAASGWVVAGRRRRLARLLCIPVRCAELECIQSNALIFITEEIYK